MIENYLQIGTILVLMLAVLLLYVVRIYLKTTTTLTKEPTAEKEQSDLGSS